MTVETPDASVQATDASIGRAAGKGLGWSLLGNIGTKIVSFGVSLVLARLLSPSDYGTFAIASAAALFVMMINDVGIISGTVQWRGELEDMAPTATTMAMLFSAIVYAALWLVAPAYSRLAGDPHATPVVRLLALIIIVDGITAVRTAALMRRFQQGRLTLANTIGFVGFGASSILLATNGAGPYAFAVGQVVGASITGVFVWTFGRLPARVGLDRAVAVRLLRFGLPLAAGLAVEAVLVNTDYIIVGQLLNVVSLGFYLLAFNVSSWAQNMIGAAIKNVSIAAFSRLSEGDTEALSRGVQRSVSLLAMGIMPIIGLMAVLASQMIHVLYGTKWAPAVPVLQFLMILAGVRLFTSLAADALVGAGATRWTLWVNLGWVVVLVPALIIGTHLNGIRGTAIAHAVVGLFVALPLTAFALNRVGVRLGPIPRTLVRPLLGGLACALAAWAVARVTGPHAIVELGAGGLAGLLCYVAIAATPAQFRQVLVVVRRRTAHAVP